MEGAVYSPVTGSTDPREPGSTAHMSPMSTMPLVWTLASRCTEPSGGATTSLTDTLSTAPPEAPGGATTTVAAPSTPAAAFRATTW